MRLWLRRHSGVACFSFCKSFQSHSRYFKLKYLTHAQVHGPKQHIFQTQKHTFGIQSNNLIERISISHVNHCTHCAKSSCVGFWCMFLFYVLLKQQKAVTGKSRYYDIQRQEMGLRRLTTKPIETQGIKCIHTC